MIAQLRPLYERRWLVLHEQARRLGFANYAALCDRLRGLDLEWLKEQARRVLQVTREPFLRLLQAELDRVGIPMDEAQTCDLAWIFRAERFDGDFPQARLIPALTMTLRGLGIRIEEQYGLTLDLEPRPGKSTRAFCASIRVPDEIKLVINPRGGQQDYRAMLHEAGHAQHSAHTDPHLPFAYRCLGDDSVSEGFAFLFESLSQNPRWLTRVLDVEPRRDYRQLS